MKVLLTGASGFIGGHVLTSLIETFGKDSVVALTSKSIPDVNCLVYKETSDFGLAGDAFNDVTHIIHAGAFTPKNAQQSNNIDCSFDNISFTKELLSFEYFKLSRVVNLSTLDVYSAASKVLTEDSEIKPISLYGFSKLYCEEMIKHFSSQKKIDFINLRVGHVYGPGEEKYKKVLPIAMQNILEGKPIELWGDGSDLRSFIFIKDVVSSIVSSLSSSAINLDINVVSRVAISIKELLNKVIEVSGEDIEIYQRDSSHEKRDLVFDNTRLLSTVLEKETDLLGGLMVEYKYMKSKYEHNI